MSENNVWSNNEKAFFDAFLEQPDRDKAGIILEPTWEEKADSIRKNRVMADRAKKVSKLIDEHKLLDPNGYRPSPETTERDLKIFEIKHERREKWIEDRRLRKIAEAEEEEVGIELGRQLSRYEKS